MKYFAKTKKEEILIPFVEREFENSPGFLSHRQIA